MLIKWKNEEDTDGAKINLSDSVLRFRFSHFLTFLPSLCIFSTQNSLKSIIFVKIREDFKVKYGFDF